jgi:hypothetical protein
MFGQNHPSILTDKNMSRVVDSKPLYGQSFQGEDEMADSWSSSFSLLDSREATFFDCDGESYSTHDAVRITEKNASVDSVPGVREN